MGYLDQSMVKLSWPIQRQAPYRGNPLQAYSLAPNCQQESRHRSRSGAAWIQRSSIVKSVTDKNKLACSSHYRKSIGTNSTELCQIYEQHQMNTADSTIQRYLLSVRKVNLPMSDRPIIAHSSEQGQSMSVSMCEDTAFIESISFG